MKKLLLALLAFDALRSTWVRVVTVFYCIAAGILMGIQQVGIGQRDDTIKRQGAAMARWANDLAECQAERQQQSLGLYQVYPVIVANAGNPYVAHVCASEQEARLYVAEAHAERAKNYEWELPYTWSEECVIPRVKHWSNKSRR